MSSKKIVIERTRDLNYLKFVATDFSPKTISPRLVPRPFYARSARWERDKGLVPVVRACVEFYWNPGKIVFFGIFSILT